MRGKRLRLINPVADRTAGLAGNVRSIHPPLNLACLASLSPSSWEVTIEDENLKRHEPTADVDAVGITSFTSTAPRAYQLAAAYQKMGIPTIAGGVHPWACTNEALSHGFDAVVIGEAENCWDEVCFDIERGVLAKTYSTGPTEEFAIPKRSLLGKYPQESIFTSRGCGEGCRFCAVTRMSGSRYRRQRLDLILRDIEAIQGKELFFCDDSFRGPGPKHRAEAIEILKAITPFEKTFVLQSTMEACHDEEFLAVARKAGCHLLFVGLETGDDEGLRLVGKRLNRKHGFDFSKVHAAGIGVLGSFLVGLDSDTPEKLKQHAEFMRNCGCDCMQLTLATPLPGTAFFEEMERDRRLLYRDFPRDWSRFSLTELVYVPKGFRSVSHFYDCLFPLVHEIYDDDGIKKMAMRTLSLTGDKTTARYAYYCNSIYRDATLSHASKWSKYREQTKEPVS